MIRTTLFRFFRVVSPPPGWLVTAMGLVTVSGCATLWMNPSDVDSALGPVLLLQMFAASSGFTHAAARGHFNPVLVGGRSRTHVALASFAAAATPGLSAWVAVSLCAALLDRTTEAVAANRIVAMWLVSCVAWAVGTTLPRLAAGVLWSMALVALALSRGALPDVVLTVQQVPQTLSQVMTVAGVCFLCPFLLLGNFAGIHNGLALALDALCAAMLVGAASVYLCRRDYTLVDPA